MIRRTIERGGSVLVPAFAVDRTEVVLKALADMREEGRIPKVPVYVNSPMAAKALEVYTTLTDELRDDLEPSDLVRFPDLREVRSTEESRALTAKGGHGPAIIIASSGMATGGRVLHHLEQMLPDPKNAVVLTGYQAVGTRGWKLIEGATQIKMRGRYVPVRAEIFQDREFSVHGDCSDLIDWVRCLDPGLRPSTASTVSRTRPQSWRPGSPRSSASRRSFPATARWWCWTASTSSPRRRRWRPPSPHARRNPWRWTPRRLNCQGTG